MDDLRYSRDALFWLLIVRGAAGDRTILRHPPDLSALTADVSSLDDAALCRLGFTAGAMSEYARRDTRSVEPDLRWLEDERHHLVPISDARYPALLREISDPPPALFVRGETSALARLQLAIVGSRSPTADGRRNAFEFGRALARHGFATTSGLAVGIDSQAHLGALHEDGVTVAVLGSGPDIVYPASNRELAERIAGCGAVVSEFPTECQPFASNFPRRNRIISGLSVGTLVVEAALRSGSLITARHALDQGREVFAIPGNIRNPLTRGCHALLRQGAKLVEQIEDILEEIGPLSSIDRRSHHAEPAHSAGMKPLDAEFKLLLDNIGFEPVHIDFLIEVTKLPVQEATACLSNMEIAGLIDALPGGSYMRR
ncbi:MAG: DNA-protecting protein DprA [Gammaproteobacteria bacterium]|nr:DNA-protecting protein DprA [Gammaproteobacteria bacterium]